jgi:hypothetical protein
VAAEEAIEKLELGFPENPARGQSSEAKTVITGNFQTKSDYYKYGSLTKPPHG